MHNVTETVPSHRKVNPALAFHKTHVIHMKTQTRCNKNQTRSEGEMVDGVPCRAAETFRAAIGSSQQPPCNKRLWVITESIMVPSEHQIAV